MILLLSNNIANLDISRQKKKEESLHTFVKDALIRNINDNIQNSNVCNSVK